MGVVSSWFRRGSLLLTKPFLDTTAGVIKRGILLLGHPAPLRTSLVLES